MKRSRISEEQIIAILREQETRVPVAYLCRKRGLSSPTFYKWKAQRGGRPMKCSRQRRTAVLLTPATYVISMVPSPSAVARTIRARQTCFFGLLR